MKSLHHRKNILLAMLASTFLVTGPAFAQAEASDAAEKSDDEIVVTAQKREQNLQDVPISIQALSTKKLDQLNVTNFNDFSKLLPSVSFQSSQPGVTTVYMRGVASGGDGNHSGSLPSVGVYLDEQPVTTIGGTLDVHVYDVARIESLAGPQGTLYGASSQAGTIRIITNKPSTSGFEGRVDGEINKIEKGGVGGRLEGMINAPLSDMAALRVVGWYQKDAGYIDNVAGTRSFLPRPGGITINNAALVKKDFNNGEVYGGRAALKVDLDDNWTVTPTVLYQQQKNNGVYSYDPRVGDLKVQRFLPDNRSDKFIQAAMTIEGKLGNWDLTYAGAYLDRKTASANDYTDYAEAYDALYESSGGLAGYFYLQNSVGATINPQQFVLGTDHFKKMSHELRVASPQDERFRIVAGMFYQNQSNEIHQDYQIKNLGPNLSVNGLPGTLWLTEQFRRDKDYAVFGEAAFDILPNLTLTGGGRAYIFDNSLIGFFGFGRNPGNGFSDSPPNGAGSNRTGVAQCFTQSGQRLYDRNTDTYATSRVLLPAAVAGGPCTNLGTFVTGLGVRPVKTSGQGFTHRVNLTWKPSEDLLTYATWSRGFRPGGVNRRGTVGPYAPDFLTNYEIGFKATLLDGALRFNATAYKQKWKTFQYSFLGENSFTEIRNGSDADIKGIEADLSFKPVQGLSITAAGSYTDAKTVQNLCNISDPTFSCTAVGSFSAPGGTRLPITPKVKLSGVARYAFPIGSGEGHIQSVVAYQSSASSEIRVIQAAQLGRIKAFTTADFAAGYDVGNLTFELYLQNAFDERGELGRGSACGQCNSRTYILITKPRSFGFRIGSKF
jgi:iron complex outermembrane recepter protein